MTDRRTLHLCAAIALAILGGCYTGRAVDLNAAPTTPATDTDPTDPAPGQAPGTTTAKPKGMPCDVAAIVANACGECHGSTPSGGSTLRLVSYEDFTAPSEGDPSKTVAEVALARMKSETRPMPPTGNLGAAAIGLMQAWLDAHTPRGTCNDGPAQVAEEELPDAGPDTTGEEVVDAGPDAPYSPPFRVVDAGPVEPVSVCTSHRNGPAFASELMNPGRSCVKSCHGFAGATPLTVAGTVYPTVREPDKCVGVEGLKVLIVDANGNPTSIDTNASGNFILQEEVVKPFRAMVISPRGVRTMNTPQMNGDCNSCHTEKGANGAPGRIMAP